VDAALKRGISYAVWPCVMVGSLVAAAWGFDKGYSVGLWAFATSTANFVVVFGLERVLPRQPGIVRLGDPQLPKDIGHGILVGGLGRPLAGAMAAGSIGMLGAVGWHHGHALRWPSGWPDAFQILLALLLSSLVGYWSHRWFHRSFLWRFHALHHDVSDMHVFKGNRIHIGEDVIRQFVMLLPLYALGVPGRVLVWIALWNNFEGALAHSNVAQAFPSAAHWILPTPQNHYVHHALDRDLHDANFAGFTPLWDVVFGTFRHPGDHPVTAMGIEDSTVPRGFGAQLAYPLRRAALTPSRTG
jgi:sterol desaturase/sphingolipid hydroxylase (fatty acid hydroxylase superfamily)